MGVTEIAGHDDATAILLAGHTPGLRLLGVSTIGGNQTLAKAGALAFASLMRNTSTSLCVFGQVTKNALDVLDAIGLSHIDVVAGKAVNVMFEAIAAAHAELAKEHEARAAGGECGGGTGEAECPRVRLVCTGALTNAALLLALYPEAAQWVELVLMGGAMGVGNTGPVMEFNIQTDELLLFFADTYKRVFKFDDPPLHLFECRRMRVDVETCSPLSAGQTVCDMWGQSPLPANANVALSVDVPAFWQLLLQAVARADAVSPLNRGHERL
eukprot:XP_001692303.1 predicted protein [Chlamydomonas reinhardtii]